MRYAELERMHVENISITAGNLFTIFVSFGSKNTDIVELSLVGPIFQSLLLRTLFDVTCELIRTVEESILGVTVDDLWLLKTTFVCSRKDAERVVCLASEKGVPGNLRASRLPASVPALHFIGML